MIYDVIAIGKRLRELRESKKLTQVQLSEALSNQYHISIEDRSISRYENGRSLLSTEKLICLANFFDTSTDYILYGKKVSEENSFTWYDNFKRLNRMMLTMQIVLHRDKENPSNVYLQLLDDEAKEWFGRMERFIDNKRLMFDRKGKEKNIDIRELDDLFKDFEKDQTQLDPIDERWKRQLLFAVPIATVRVKEETGEIVITAKKQKQ